MIKESYNIRKMLEDDLTVVSEIENQCSTEAPWSIGIFHDCLKAQYGCWVLEQNQQIIGFGILSVAIGEAHVLNIAIRPDFQRKGLGQKLLDHLISSAKAQQAHMLFLEVRVSNQKAISLYLKLGFQEIGRRKQYYLTQNGREDAIMLALQLS